MSYGEAAFGDAAYGDSGAVAVAGAVDGVMPLTENADLFHAAALVPILAASMVADPAMLVFVVELDLGQLDS